MNSEVQMYVKTLGVLKNTGKKEKEKNSALEEEIEINDISQFMDFDYQEEDITEEEEKAFLDMGENDKVVVPASSLRSFEDMFNESETDEINALLFKLDKEISALASVSLNVEGLKSGEEILEQAIKSSERNTKEIEAEITKVIIAKVIEERDEDDTGRSLNDIFKDKKISEKVLAEVKLFEGENNRLDDIELMSNSPVVSTIYQFSPLEMLNDMKMSESLFAPVLQAYLKVFDNDDHFMEIIEPFTETPVYSEDILKSF